MSENPPGWKDTNPKDAMGALKAYQSVISYPVMYEVGLGMLEGALKYGRHNYRAIGVRASVYYDGARRHLDAWWEGEDMDTEAKIPGGIHHVSKAISDLMVLRDAMIQGKFTDDRPPPAKPGWLAECNAKAKQMIEECKAPKDAYTRENWPPKDQPALHRWLAHDSCPQFLTCSFGGKCLEFEHCEGKGEPLALAPSSEGVTTRYVLPQDCDSMKRCAEEGICLDLGCQGKGLPLLTVPHAF